MTLAEVIQVSGITDFLIELCYVRVTVVGTGDFDYALIDSSEAGLFPDGKQGYNNWSIYDKRKEVNVFKTPQFPTEIHLNTQCSRLISLYVSVRN